MPGSRFRTGLHIQLRGRGEYVIERRLPGGEIQLKELASNKCSSADEGSLIELLFDGGLEILSDTQNSSLAERGASKYLVADLSLLNDDLKREARRRYHYVCEVNRQKQPKLTKGGLAPVIEKVSREISDTSPPRWITLYRWCRRYQASGGDVRTLVPAYSRRGNKRRKFCGGDADKAGAVVRIIEEVVNEKYLSKQRRTVASVCDAVEARVARSNQLRDPEDRLTPPDKVSIYRIINKLDPFDVMKARYGERIAKSKYEATKQGPRPTRPLERVEIDHTKLDMLVVDSVSRLPVGRPWLTIALDVYSKMVAGMCISFDPPGYLTVMQCLRHAIRSKGYVKDEYPKVKNTWDAYGIPELIVCDNGPEFHSTHLEDACLQLGMVIHYAPVKRGQYKGSVERYFRTINQQLIHQHPGTTFSNIIERADYDSKKNAVISFDTLKEIVHIFIVDVYHQSEHRALGSSPARVWEAAIEEYPPALPPRQADVDLLLGCIEPRSVSAYGIELHSLRYNSERLARLSRTLQRGEKVTVKYDPTDLSQIHVADMEEGEYFPVPSVHPQYTANLTLWQHRIIRRHARHKAKGDIDITSLCLAKEEIQNIVEREWMTTKKTRSRQRLARYKNYGQQPEEHVKTVNGRKGGFALIKSRKNDSPSLMGDEKTWEGATGFAGDDNFARRGRDETRERSSEIIVRPQSGHTLRAGKPFPITHGDSVSEESEADMNLDMAGWGADYELPK